MAKATKRKSPRKPPAKAQRVIAHHDPGQKVVAPLLRSTGLPQRNK